jgi:hypothetical protein
LLGMHAARLLCAVLTCALRLQLADAYALYAQAVGSGAGSLTVEADHWLTVATQRTRTSFPKDFVALSLRSAGCALRQGKPSVALKYYQDAFDAVGLLANAKNFDVYDADLKHKSPSGMPIFFFHARSHLVEGLEAVVARYVIYPELG